MTTTPRLGAPELVSAQATPETTVNEQIRYVEQGASYFIVKDKDLTSAPGSPSDGDAYIVATGATGTWAGKDGLIAFRMSTGWLYITPIEGTLAYAQDKNARYIFSGTAWGADTTGGSGATGDVVGPGSATDGHVAVFDGATGKLLKGGTSATGSGLTMSTAKILGRATASTGNIEEIAIGAGLSMSGGTLSTSSGSSAMSVMDTLYKMRAEANITLIQSSGTMYDAIVDKGGFVIIALCGICANTTYRTATNTYTVPTGKIAVVVDIFADTNTQQNTNVKARLINTTDSVAAAPNSASATSTTAGVFKNSGSLPFVTTLNTDIPFPDYSWGAGDVLRAEIGATVATAERPVHSFYVLAIVDATTHLLEAVT